MGTPSATGFDTVGGWAALLCGGTYLFGFAVLLAVLEPAGFLAIGSDAQATRANLTGNAAILRLWYLVIYVLNALALVALVLALEHRLAPGAPVLATLGKGIGLIWAALVLGAGMVANVGLAAALEAPTAVDAARIWEVATLIETGIGGGNEIAGGVWIILVSLAGRASRGIPRPLTWLGLFIGVVGLLTVPDLTEAFGAIFGLGFIVWFLWIGVVLLRRPRRAG